MKMFRSMNEVTREDKIRGNIRVALIVNKMQRNRTRWIRHVRKETDSKIGELIERKVENEEDMVWFMIKC